MSTFRDSNNEFFVVPSGFGPAPTLQYDFKIDDTVCGHLKPLSLDEPFGAAQRDYSLSFGKSSYKIQVYQEIFQIIVTFQFSEDKKIEARWIPGFSVGKYYGCFNFEYNGKDYLVGIFEDSPIPKRYFVQENEVVIGKIVKKKMFSRIKKIDLPDEIPLEIQGFIFFLTTHMK